MASQQVFTNARIFANSDARKETADFASCMVIEGDRILYTGSEQDAFVKQAISNGATSIDLNNRVIAPGLIDAHTHLLFFGLSRLKLDLTYCMTLAEVREAISSYAKSHPEMPRILCRGWQQPSTGRLALATMLDDLDPRPIYVEALDLHSTWVNTAALNELPLENAQEYGSHQVAMDENGKPTGLFAEGALVDIVWPFLTDLYTVEEKQIALQTTFDAYVSAGYTGAIDMAMDHVAWDALKLYRERNGSLPIHIAAHWLIKPPGSGPDLTTKINEAITLHQEWNPKTSPEFCIVGIKLICDGVVDGCTAAMSHPYVGHSTIVDPLWPADAMNEVVTHAAHAGLQIAIHAIGDFAVTQALNALEKAATPHGRHRIEHLEVTSEQDALRLGQLGITASVQPVHSDPAILQDYPSLIGPASWSRAFAYKDFLDAGACVAFGTDAPTAVHLPMPNLYTATTRRSGLRPEMEERTMPEQAFTVSQAFHAATAGAAYSRGAEGWTGSLREGLRADFVVLECSWKAEELLEGRVLETWGRGKKLHSEV